MGFLQHKEHIPDQAITFGVTGRRQTLVAMVGYPGGLVAFDAEILPHRFSHLSSNYREQKRPQLGSIRAILRESFDKPEAITQTFA
jgi:mRNA-degrading endonuclease HigB of HigAB toxin-antitoxin module